jgi:hypothetical protein
MQRLDARNKILRSASTPKGKQDILAQEGQGQVKTVIISNGMMFSPTFAKCSFYLSIDFRRAQISKL